MALESLGSVFRDAGKNKSLNRIYRAHQLQERISTLLGAAVTVSLRGEKVSLWCDSESLAVLARLKKTRLLALAHQTLATKQLQLTIRVRPLHRTN